MARILILSLIFRPDNVSTAQIMGDLALDLQAAGHEVFIISTVPHFNEDAEALAGQPLHGYWGSMLQKSNYHGMEVLHVWMPRKGRSKLLRILAWLGFHLISTLAGFFTSFKPDIILAPSPPLTIGVSAWLISIWRGCPFIYNVQEIYPDVAVNLGVLKNKGVIKLLKGVEKLVYAKAQALAVISNGMADHIRNCGVPEEKIKIIPNFVDFDDLYPLPKDNNFGRRYGFTKKFVISYAGNMGAPQGLEKLIEAAYLLRQEEGIHFLMMGDGSEYPALKNQARRLRLTNITFLPYQPYSLMAEAYAAVDASFVSQAPGTCNDGIPSKVYRIMACARPVIACTESGSDLAWLIEKSTGGVVVQSGDSASLARTIAEAFSHSEEWRARGSNARQFVLKDYSRKTVSATYHELIMHLLNRKNAAVSDRSVGNSGGK